MSIQTIRDLYGLSAVKAYQPKFYSTLPPLEDQIKSDRLVGIEVEVENANTKRGFYTEVWAPVGDGSLRNHGTEYITRPIPASVAPWALWELLHEVLHNDCCFSPRTSVHVHVNCQDLTEAQVADVVLMYSCLEPLFYQFAGRGRARNIYCVPLHDTQLVYALASHPLSRSQQSWSKYTGLNIVPLGEKGTIEFRQMHGTFDYKKLTVWVRLITKLFDYVLTKGTTVTRKMVSGMGKDTDVFGILTEMLGEDVHVFKSVEYSVIKNAVENTRTAFLVPGMQNELLKSRDIKSAYFTSRKGA